MTATLHTAGHFNSMGLPTVDFAPIEETVVAVARSLKNVALFVAAPFIGLVYAVALPFVGLAMLAWIGGRAVVKAPATYAALVAVKNAALVLAAPLIGLAYAVALPVIGVALIAKLGYQAYRAPALTA